MAIESFFPQQPRTGNVELRLPSSIPIRYKDVNSEYSQDTNGIIVYDETAIRQKIMNLLGVVPGEEHFEPEWGSQLPYRLFEPVNQITAHWIEFDTIGAVNTFMSSEVSLLHNECVVEMLDDEEGYEIILAYQAIRTEIVDRLRFRLMAKR
jgi:phage baseplate assembly protein W